MRSVYSTDDYALIIERELIDVTTSGHHELDPDWSVVDTGGHAHSGYDRLTWTIVSTYWCHSCHEDHEEGEWRCSICGDLVEPRLVWREGIKTYIPGLAAGTLLLADGRTFFLRPDEMTVPPSGIDGLVEKVSQRDPDEWRLTFGASA